MLDHSLRALFPYFNRPDHASVYLDHAATSQKPQQVIDAITRFYTEENANVHRASHDDGVAVTNKFEQARAELADFIGANEAKEIIWTRGTTESINLVANGLAKSNLLKGTKVLVSPLAHHANLVPWQQLCHALGLSLHVLPIDNKGVLDLAASLAMFDEEVALLAMDHVSNVLGNIEPVAELVAKAREVGALSLIDGAQAVGHLAVDVQALGCDFYAFSGHKMFGPTGIGVLWGKAELLEQLPPAQTGGEMVRTVSYQHSDFQGLPYKFEAGTPNIAGVLGLAEAAAFVRHHRDDIAKQEQALYDYLLAQLQPFSDLNFWGELERSTAVLSFSHKHIHSADLGALLNQQGIAVRVGHHCAMPLVNSLDEQGTIRVAIGPYNNHADIDRFIQALTLAISSLSDHQELPQPVAEPTQTHLPLAEKIKEAKGWDNVYREIMLAGKSVKPDATLQVDDNQIHGCESPVWLSVTSAANKVNIGFYSSGKIIRGLLAIMLEPAQGQTPEFIQRFDFAAHLAELGLEKQLSQSRNNGLSAVISQLKQLLKG